MSGATSVLFFWSLINRDPIPSFLKSFSLPQGVKNPRPQSTIYNLPSTTSYILLLNLSTHNRTYLAFFLTFRIPRPPPACKMSNRNFSWFQNDKRDNILLKGSIQNSKNSNKKKKFLQKVKLLLLRGGKFSHAENHRDQDRWGEMGWGWGRTEGKKLLIKERGGDRDLSSCL